MKKDHWVNSVLQSASEIREVEANPFLWDKFNARLANDAISSKPSMNYKLSWAVAVVLVVALNVSTLIIRSVKDHKQNEVASVAALSDELNSNITYNY
jgi:hypothetical protein